MLFCGHDPHVRHTTCTSVRGFDFDNSFNNANLYHLFNSVRCSVRFDLNRPSSVRVVTHRIGVIVCVCVCLFSYRLCREHLSLARYSRVPITLCAR